MLTADWLSVAANITLFMILVRLIQTHFAKDSTFGSAIAFIFH